MTNTQTTLLHLISALICFTLLSMTGCKKDPDPGPNPDPTLEEILTSNNGTWNATSVVSVMSDGNTYTEASNYTTLIFEEGGAVTVSQGSWDETGTWSYLENANQLRLPPIDFDGNFYDDIHTYDNWDILEETSSSMTLEITSFMDIYSGLTTMVLERD